MWEFYNWGEYRKATEHFDEIKIQIMKAKSCFSRHFKFIK
jgi:hypothetical protein